MTSRAKLGIRLQMREKFRLLATVWPRPLRALALALSFALVAVSYAQQPARKVIARTAPTYPDLAKKMHLSGKVKMEVVVNPAGAVTSARMIGGNPVFELSAIETVKQWKFEPAQNTSKTVVVMEFAGQ
jgi:TonB family protein